MSAKSERSKSPSPSSSGPKIVNNSRPAWLPGGPCGLTDNHDDPKKDIWISTKGEKHLGECRDMLESHDKRLLDDWKDEINTQLLVSSLLAAVAGGFVVESQKSLSEDPAITSAVVLLQIARQLNQSIGLPDTEFMAFSGPSGVERAFNSLFYASLGLSLANVTVGLLCLQWIRGLAHEPHGVHRRYYCHLRYARFQGVEQWGAKAMISTLPLLLLGSLLAFFAGLLAFASNADWITSAPLYVILPSVFAIVLFTTFVPGLVIVLNSAFRMGYQFPSLPPFRSLQSWIAMQGFIQVFQAINGVFKLKSPAHFTSLRKCLDWGQLDLLWTGWAIRDPREVLLLPVILSTSNAEGLNTISNILEGSPPAVVDPMFRKLTVLNAIVQHLGKMLPATTVGTISELWISEVTGLINVGTILPQGTFTFKIEENINLDFVATHLTVQLVNSLAFLCRNKKASGDGFWNLFWKTLSDLVLGAVPYFHDSKTAPMLFRDALDSMQITLEDPTTNTETMFQRGFNSFVEILANNMEHDRAWARSETGSAILSSIVFHPIWASARKRIATLPPGEYTTTAQKCLTTLDRMRDNIPPRPAPMGTQELDQETVSPPTHTAIDMGPLRDDDHTAPLLALCHADIYTSPGEDATDGGTEDRAALKEQLVTSMASSPLTRKTPPADLPTSPPGIPPQPV